MSDLTLSDIENLAKLSKLKVENPQNLLDELSKILDHVQSLNTVDTEGVEPQRVVIEGVHCLLGEDIPLSELKSETYLQNAPQVIGGMIQVPDVIPGEES